MGTHESSVNFENLIRDLAEMYPFEVSEVVLVELLANSLDAKASRISIDYDPRENVLVVADNGKGMAAAQFDEYHDFAAGLKTRGTGIGFAGVGAKISFNIADRVITETRSGSFTGGSDWRLESKKRLLWEDTASVRFPGNGTRVEVRFRPDAQVSYSSTNDLLRLLQRHYLPLLDTRFLDLYQQMGFYPGDFRFTINGKEVTPTDIKETLRLGNVREFTPKKAGKRIGYGVFGLAPTEYPIGEDVCGILLSTHGKVIKADLFNQFPGNLGPRLFGLVEIPPLVGFLTTSKVDFIRGRGRLREFEGLYGPVRQEFKTWLTELGVEPEETGDTKEAAKLERELSRLIGEVPELTDFFGFRTRKPVLQPSDSGTTTADPQDGSEATFPGGEGRVGGGVGPLDTGDDPGEAFAENPEGGKQRATPISRTGRRGPKVSIKEAPERVDLAWIDGNTVVINSGHPSYEKAPSGSLARRVYCLFAIGNAIQRFVISEGDGQDTMFVDRMMAAWGKK